MHLRGPVTLTPTPNAERLAVELTLHVPVLTTKSVAAGIRTPNLLLA